MVDLVSTKVPPMKMKLKTKDYTIKLSHLFNAMCVSLGSTYSITFVGHETEGIYKI